MLSLLCERSGVVQRYLNRSSHRSLASSSRVLHYLFLLNLGLQVWDGLATYLGVQLGFPEGNALLRTWMGNWGAGWALVSAKTAACGLLFLLRCLEDLFLLRCAMTLTAGLYLSFSFVPWLLVLLFR